MEGKDSLNLEPPRAALAFNTDSMVGFRRSSGDSVTEAARWNPEAGTCVLWATQVYQGWERNRYSQGRGFGFHWAEVSWVFLNTANALQVEKDSQTD